jgi:hypothetical protein
MVQVMGTATGAKGADFNQSQQFVGSVHNTHPLGWGTSTALNFCVEADVVPRE